MGGNAYVGKNGTGLVELGTGGVFNVTGNADMCSGATLKFVFGPSGTGAVRVGGNFVVDGGAHLVIDLSSYGDNSGRYRLVQAARTLGEFDLANVEIIGKPDTQRCTLTSRNGVLSCSIGRGFILIVE